jgi:HSP20 family protein
MSITRQLLHEFRPLFRMLDEPFGHSGPYLTPAVSRRRERNHLFEDPFEGLNMLGRPAVDVTEKGGKYILDADLPGVSRENLQVRLGDGNRSITIEGKVTERSSSGVHDAGPKAKPEASDIVTSAEYTDGKFFQSYHTLLIAKL